MAQRNPVLREDASSTAEIARLHLEKLAVEQSVQLLPILIRCELTSGLKTKALTILFGLCGSAGAIPEDGASNSACRVATE